MNRRGFTLIELIIMVIITALLFGVAAYKFTALREKAAEGKTKNNLNRMRSAIVAYYGDHEGVFPQDDLTSLVPRYIEKVLNVEISPVSDTVYTTKTIRGNTGAGGWYYIEDKTSPDFGKLKINLDGETADGVPWNML
ncbi:hypothetical protein Dip518_000329 [Parelusimicrobium proximum]|uniref:type II secretion system protein n=1 Tax=Parelusimicrobium proximum TaxID=3228953 RepID=UPI003D16B45D